MAGPGPDELAKRFEPHEAHVWSRCLEEAQHASARTSTPLRMTSAVFGSARVLALEGLDTFDVNRVLCLGLDGSATGDDVERLTSTYLRLGIRNYQIEVTETASASCGSELGRAGLVAHPDPIWTIWRSLDDLPDPDPDADVRVLTTDDRAALSRLQRIAWGVWEPDELHDLWFGAPLGAPDFTYFGLFLDGDLVAAGALQVEGATAWAGFDATLPRLRHQRLRHALGRHRSLLAAELGCELVHADTYHPPKLETWKLAYRKIRWLPART